MRTLTLALAAAAALGAAAAPQPDLALVATSGNSYWMEGMPRGKPATFLLDNVTSILAGGDMYVFGGSPIDLTIAAAGSLNFGAAASVFNDEGDYALYAGGAINIAAGASINGPRHTKDAGPAAGAKHAIGAAGAWVSAAVKAGPVIPCVLDEYGYNIACNGTASDVNVYSIPAGYPAKDTSYVTAVVNQPSSALAIVVDERGGVANWPVFGTWSVGPAYATPPADAPCPNLVLFLPTASQVVLAEEVAGEYTAATVFGSILAPNAAVTGNGFLLQNGGIMSQTFNASFVPGLQTSSSASENDLDLTGCTPRPDA